MDRRRFLSTGALATAALSGGAGAQTSSRRLGLTLWSYNLRWRERKSPIAGWKDALDVLDHCHQIGAGCLQIGVGKWSQDFAGKVREKRESLGIALEGQIGLPWKEEDVPRFEAGILAAMEAGATVLRTTCLGSRRYETFESMETWNEFAQKSYAALERAEPIVRKHGVKLAVENHKDWRIDEQLALFQHLSSEFIGMTFDFGNNFSLLEHPHALAEALAPYVFSTHVKDMALAEYEEGFLLSEVPLGTGVLDLKYIMDLCQKANPDIWFNLEMITRDPLQVPVFGDQYWVTMPQLPAPDLAKTLRLARAGDATSLPRTSNLSTEEKLALEEANVLQSFDYARAELGMS